MGLLYYFRIFKRMLERLCNVMSKPLYGGFTSTSNIRRNVKIYKRKNLYMSEHTNIDGGAVIMNTRANFIMKKYSGAAFGLTVITGGHLSVPGMWFKDVTDSIKDEIDVGHIEDQDIIVEEDVWIGARVTLLKGAHIGRGAVIGSGSVVRCKIPPYSLVVGNPAKVVGFKFTPDEIMEHEKKLYDVENRLSYDLVENNYKRYFLNRIHEIKKITKI